MLGFLTRLVPMLLHFQLESDDLTLSSNTGFIFDHLGHGERLELRPSPCCGI